MTSNCKSHHYTLCGLQASPQLGCLPSDVWGCLTSPAWVLVSLSPPQTHAHIISNTSVKRQLLMSLNSNCANIYALRFITPTEFVMSLFTLQVVQSITCYAISFQVQQTVLHFLFKLCFCESRDCLLSYFFHPLLKECHNCSANTEPPNMSNVYP